MVWIVPIMVWLTVLALVITIALYAVLIKRTRHVPLRETELGNRFNIFMVVLCVGAIAVTMAQLFRSSMDFIDVWEFMGAWAIIVWALAKFYIKDWRPLRRPIKMRLESRQ